MSATETYQLLCISDLLKFIFIFTRMVSVGVKSKLLGANQASV